MKFLAHVVQNGGCDYTIGCGHKVYPLEADTLDKAREKVLTRWFGFVPPYDPEAKEGEEGYEEDEGPCEDVLYSIASITLYEVASEHPLDVNLARKNYETAKKNCRDKRDKKAKEAMFLKLKKELEK